MHTYKFIFCQLTIGLGVQTTEYSYETLFSQKGKKPVSRTKYKSLGHVIAISTYYIVRLVENKS